MYLHFNSYTSDCKSACLTTLLCALWELLHVSSCVLRQGLKIIIISSIITIIFYHQHAIIFSSATKKTTINKLMGSSKAFTYTYTAHTTSWSSYLPNSIFSKVLSKACSIW